LPINILEMGLSEDADQENAEERFRSLCADLNIDKSTADEAWRNFETISKHYTLEVLISSPHYKLYLIVLANQSPFQF